MLQPTATASDQDDPPANKSAQDTKPETTSIELNLRIDTLLLETSSDAAVGKRDDDTLALATCNTTEDDGKDEPVVGFLCVGATRRDNCVQSAGGGEE
jgi:hypothetical protein